RPRPAQNPNFSAHQVSAPSRKFLSRFTASIAAASAAALALRLWYDGPWRFPRAEDERKQTIPRNPMDD
ncbi:MAG: hypothetical protein WBL75_11635, partial [Candidatus Acidiferrum sp.]